MRALTKAAARRKLEIFGAVAMAQASEERDRREWINLHETIAR